MDYTAYDARINAEAKAAKTAVVKRRIRKVLLGGAAVGGAMFGMMVWALSTTPRVPAGASAAVAPVESTPALQQYAYSAPPAAASAQPVPEATYENDAERVKAQAKDYMAQRLLDRCDRDWLPSTCAQMRAELEAANR